MALGERIRTILEEQNLKQTAFAKSLGVSTNYINQIVNNKKISISGTLAKLIEETYGYSAQWILSGTGNKLSPNNLTREKAEIIKKINKMSDAETKAVHAFIKVLNENNN